MRSDTTNHQEKARTGEDLCSREPQGPVPSACTPWGGPGDRAESLEEGEGSLQASPPPSHPLLLYLEGGGDKPTLTHSLTVCFKSSQNTAYPHLRNKRFEQGEEHL